MTPSQAPKGAALSIIPEWIEHDGKGMPVSGETVVCIRVRGGQETPEKWMSKATTWEWRWTDERASEPQKSGDIIAYRVITPTHPQLPKESEI